MSFRRAGHSDERRRRVLLEDAAAATEPAAPTKKPRDAKPGRNYSDAALVANQPPLTCLMMTRPWSLAVVLLTALAILELLLLAHCELPRLAQHLGIKTHAPLELGGRGSIASWLAAVALGWAAIAAVQIYHLRRHRIDDYKGRYRVWLLAAVLLASASLAVVTGLPAALGEIVAFLAGQTQASSAMLLGQAACATLAAIVALRLGIEMRRSRGALVSLACALVAYGLAAGAALDAFPLHHEMAALAGHAAAWLGHLLTCYTTLVYARYVYLDSQNLLLVKPRREKKPKAVKEKPAVEKGVTGKDVAAPAKPDKEPTAAAKQVRIDSAHTGATQAPTAAPSKAQPASTGGPLRAAMISSATNKSPATTNAAAADPRKLSKAERKRLRRAGQLDDDDDE